MATRVSSKGWIVIPKELRKKYRLTPGREVAVVDYGRTLGIVPVDDHPVRAAPHVRRGRPALADRDAATGAPPRPEAG